jgi:MFS family permease
MPPVQRFLPPAFSKPRFRVFAAGQAISVLGSWMQQVALAWLVYRLTSSVFLLGLTGFLLQIPHLFIAPVAGHLIDRLPRVRTLILINACLGVLASILAAVTLWGLTRIEIYLALALLIGIANACEAPTRQSLIGTIVEDRALLPSAIGFNSVMFNSGRLIGPAMAGLLLRHFSEGVCFTLNAVSFVAIIGALIAMRLKDTPRAAGPGADGADLVGTLRHFWALPVAKYLMPTASTVALCALPLTQLMPSIAVGFFDGNAATVGMLLSASGAGALSSAVLLSMQSGHRLQLRAVQVAPFLAGGGLLLFAFSRSLWLSIPLLTIVGGSVLATSVSTNTLLQQSVDDGWRGRVIGFYIMLFIGLAPLGNLLSGTLAATFGLAFALSLNGLLVLLAATLAQVRLRSSGEAMARLRASVRL